MSAIENGLYKRERLKTSLRESAQVLLELSHFFQSDWLRNPSQYDQSGQIYQSDQITLSESDSQANMTSPVDRTEVRRKHHC